MLVAASGLAIAAVLVNFYVIPYQSITGVLIDGRQVDWFTGEALFALGWAALFLIFGTLAYRVIRRSYATNEVEQPSLEDGVGEP